MILKHWPKRVNSVDEVRIICLGVTVNSDFIYINGFVPVENVSNRSYSWEDIYRSTSPFVVVSCSWHVVTLFQVKCTLLRQFSVLGSVTVNYVFLGQSKALSMAQGEFSKEFDIDIADSNDKPEKDRVVFLNLTGVSGSKQCSFFAYLPYSINFWKFSWKFSAIDFIHFWDQVRDPID